MKFFEGYSWFKFNNFGLAPRYGLEILHKLGKRIKNKSQKIFGTNFYVCRSYRRKTGRFGGGGSAFRPTPS